MNRREQGISWYSLWLCADVQKSSRNLCDPLSFTLQDRGESFAFCFNLETDSEIVLKQTRSNLHNVTNALAETSALNPHRNQIQA